MLTAFFLFSKLIFISFKAKYLTSIKYQEYRRVDIDQRATIISSKQR
jgi:hypothetical protein